MSGGVLSSLISPSLPFGANASGYDLAPCPVYGHLRYNETLCLPCPAGFLCLMHTIVACGGGMWTEVGGTSCRPCTVCLDFEFALHECTRGHDTVCHACPEGFAVKNQSCVLDESTSPAATVGHFLLLMAELLLYAALMHYCICRATVIKHGSPAALTRQRRAASSSSARSSSAWGEAISEEDQAVLLA